ncbi:hypothetical protein RD792_005397 [Penstemon davidsonii]|uniref:S-type anion channel n=1 Tax=Penstemon davidsonii TaxID=160366 RepID=A0ABR0DK19_9LAMI|nr:hypothetical protein RD792_005397 [Penstemon davidsonii]
MEDNKQNHSANEVSSEVLPTLIKAITENEVSGFDSIKEINVNNGMKSTCLPPLSPKVFKFESASMELQDGLSRSKRTQLISISMPPSPIEDHVLNIKRVLFKDDDTVCGKEIPTYKKVGRKEKQAKFYSQPMPKGSILNEAIVTGKFSNHKLKYGRYDSFKTWSGKLERNISNLRGKHRETDQQPQNQKPTEVGNLPVDRYFDALEGPELDKLRDSEEILLPEDQQWPFLLRFPIASFGICLGVSSQAVMWKALASSSSTKFLHVSPDINIIMWFISVAVMLIVTSIYALKVLFYFEAVRREYYHPIRVNFFFAPWTTLLFLALGIPPSISPTLHASLWYVLMTPILFLELKIYGQWMSGGQRRLSKVANPSNHLSVIGNFVGALLGASMGLKEGPTFFFAVGLAHYTVLFVTLYQRLPTNETLPKDLHPVFFLFVAAPSVASMAWERIQGSFDYGSKIAYFIAVFLYFSLFSVGRSIVHHIDPFFNETDPFVLGLGQPVLGRVRSVSTSFVVSQLLLYWVDLLCAGHVVHGKAVRVNFFRGIRFSLAWWAYTFPMTGAAVATIRYSTVVPNVLTKTLSVFLCIVSTLTVASLLVITMIHAFVLGDLFPNDMAIAISDRRPKTRKWYHRRTGSSDNNIEKFLKYSSSDGKDIESAMNPPSSHNQECP